MTHFFNLLKYFKETSLVSGLLYSPVVFTAKHASGKSLYIVLLYTIYYYIYGVEGSQIILLILPLFIFA